MKDKSINLKSYINKKNGQIKFELKKRNLPKEIIDKLPKLKSLRLNLKDLRFEEDFESKFNKDKSW